MVHIIRSHCLNLFNVLRSISFFRLDTHKTDSHGRQLCWGAKLKGCQGEQEERWKTYQIGNKKSQLAPFLRKEFSLLVLCMACKSHTSINDDTSSINILDYYQCLREILLAAAVH